VAPTESGLSALAATLRALEGVAARRLGSTRQQQQDLEVEMSNKMGRIDNAEREVALLRQELAKQRAARVRASGELDAQLAKLQDELVMSQKLAGAELQGMQGAGAAKAASIADVHAKTEAALQAQLEKLQADLKAAADAHVDAEANLRKRRARAKLEIEGLVQEFDKAQAAAQAEIDAVRASIEYERKPLEDLKRYYGKVDDELGRLEDERLKAERKYFVEVTVEAVRRRIAGMALLRFYKPLKVLKREQEKWEAKERAKKGK
jgi:chromosome segregation ATPase